MDFLIRAFTPEDYPAMVEIVNAAWPDFDMTVEEMRFDDEHRDPKCAFERWVGIHEGKVVAVGHYSQTAGMYHPRKFGINISVHPNYQGRGFGKALYNHILEALQPFDPILLRAYCREDMARSVRFLQDRGFEEEERSWESRLDVAAFDPTPYEGLEQKVRAKGIEIKTLRELESDPERDRKLYELDYEVSQDMPTPEPLTPVDFEHYRERMFKHPDLLPDAFFVAVHKGEYVGMSNLWAGQATDHLFTGLTGVKREFRRMGIALALKLRGIAYAKERGCPVIRTWNSTLNRPILSINERLGFVKQPVWIGFKKVLKEE